MNVFNKLIRILILGIFIAIPMAQSNFVASAEEPVAVEITSLRTENTKTFEYENGVRKITISLAPLHYKVNYSDKLEQWKEIDLRIVNNHIENAPFILDYNSTTGEFTLKDRKTSQITTIKLNSIGLSTINNFTPSLTSSERNSSISTKNIITNIDYNITIDSTGVRFTRIVKDVSAPTTATFTITGSKTNLKYQARDADGKKISVLSSYIGDVLTESLPSTVGVKYPISIDPTWQVGASTDDAGESLGTTGYFSTGAGTYCDFGDEGGGFAKIGFGARFTSVTIPKSATITSAYLTLVARANFAGDTANARISAEDTDDAATFSTQANFDARTRTAKVDWDAIPHFTSGTSYDTPDFSSAVQTVVNRAGWTSGNDIVIFLDDFDDRSDAGAWRGTQNFDDGGALAPVLTVTYASPTISSTYVEGFGSDWAILRGQVVSSPNGPITTASINYGLTTAYGANTSISTSLTAGEYFVITIRGLTPGTVYHWQAYGSDVSQTAFGQDMYFVTKGSPAIYEFLNTGGDSDSSSNISMGNWVAMSFTTNTSAHSVTNIRLPLKRVGTTPGTITVSLKHATSSFTPTGIDLMSATIDGDTISTTYSYWNFEVDEDTIIANTPYSIVIRALGGDASNYIKWQRDAGGSLADAVGMSSSDGGVTWTSNTPVDYLFEIWGNPAIAVNDAKVFQSYAASNDLLFVAYTHNIYPPYYPSQAIEDYFDLILYDTDGTTVLASTPMTQWGEKPHSIYIGAGSAAALTLGSNYYIKIVGSFDSSVVAAYQLQSSDWLGSNLVSLDNWVRTVASQEETYYGITLTTSIIGRGVVLNNEGGAIFENGILGLSIYRPNLFKMQVGTTATSVGTTPADSFSPTKDWEVNVGPQIVAIATDAGSLIGLDAYAGISMILFIVFSCFAIFLLATGKFLFATISGLPIILLGMDLGIIAATYVGLFIAILVLVFIWEVWLTRVS